MTVDQRSGRPACGTGVRARGFTLIELMVTIVVLAILLSIAIPSFNDASLSSKLSGFANNLLASVQLARSEAIKSNTVVTLCASANGTTCAASGGWQQGWIVRDVANRVLQHQQALQTGFRVTQAGGNAVLSFQPIGVGATAATFTVCRNAPLGNQERVVTISATGVAYVTRTEAGACP
jgi:type IV fimbrial biogenesis protein FimT